MKKVFYNLYSLTLGLIILAIDFASKKYALIHIPEPSSDVYPYGGIPIFENFYGINFSLNFVRNQGAAWGLFSDYPNLLAYVRIVIIAALFYYLLKKGGPFLKRLALAMICFGALGNLIDHFLYGYVIDFFHFSFMQYDFPVFNIADSAIFLGVCYLLLSKSK